MKQKIQSCLFVLFLMVAMVSVAQEIQVFTLADFDLKNKVKSCLVSTDYGKEEYVFNKMGYLTKSVTRYNEADYDVVYYKFKDSTLLEKRAESYRNNTFDASTSIAHFYTTDTINGLSVQERIFSYDKAFLDEYTYHYDDTGDLVSIEHINNQGKDETLVEYKKYKGEETITYLLNAEPIKSIRTSFKKNKNNQKVAVVLTKEFLNGQPSFALEEMYGANGLLTESKEFIYDLEEKNFVLSKQLSYVYDVNEMLISETSRQDEVVSVKEYIYQYDQEHGGNWIKQIVTPDNTYKTRKIEYYIDELPAEEKE